MSAVDGKRTLAISLPSVASLVNRPRTKPFCSCREVFDGRSKQQCAPFCQSAHPWPRSPFDIAGRSAVHRARWGSAAQHAPSVGAGATLFQKVRIFDGKSSDLSAPSNVLVRANRIERISTSPIAVDSGTRVIDGGGRTLMPGLIDAHWHAMLIALSPA